VKCPLICVISLLDCCRRGYKLCPEESKTNSKDFKAGYFISSVVLIVLKGLLSYFSGGNMFKRKHLGHFAVMTFFYLIQLAQSSSDEWLLRELNGGYLRLSATVVCCLFKLKIVFSS